MKGTTRRRRAAALTAGVATAVLVITACSGGDDRDDPGPSTPSPAASSTPDPSASAGPTDTPTGSTDDDGSASAPPFPANTEPDTSEPSAGAALTVTDVRVGRHDGFDRVVFELGGTGTPGWRVEYVPEAVEDGSGNVVDLDGDGTLQVMISGSGYPTDTGVAEYAGPNPLRVAETDEVEEVLLGSVFEGSTQAFVGTDEVSPFRVYALTDPTRVVVEVRNDDV
ncbi:MULTISPECIES: AMIN-like domain-containing (lipo)protein [Oerskovia]|uniref:AMIN-like domain-containing protein n=1 Tax=Oerskovia rustica TaxID=2762237 RepID=A0ABR8RSU5_9CELL|nr:hypothetical protein [Oerskovia rustica]MBD7950868.1 hypothetical protein [Oerskovia rustica]